MWLLSHIIPKIGKCMLGQKSMLSFNWIYVLKTVLELCPSICVPWTRFQTEEQILALLHVGGVGGAALIP